MGDTGEKGGRWRNSIGGRAGGAGAGPGGGGLGSVRGTRLLAAVVLVGGGGVVVVAAMVVWFGRERLVGWRRGRAEL